MSLFDDLEDESEQLEDEWVVSPGPTTLDEADLGFDPTQTTKDISKQTIVLELHVSQPGYTKKVDAHRVFKNTSEFDLELEETAPTPLDLGLFQVSKHILDRKELKQIRRTIGDLKSWVNEHKIPSRLFNSGWYLLSLQMVEEVDKRIQDAKDKLSVELQAFGVKYPGLVEEMRERLGAEFSASDYPPTEQLLSAYSIQHQWLTFDVQAALQSINQNIYQRESEKLQIQFQDAAKQSQEVLRIKFDEYVGHLAEVLGKDEKTGKPKVFRGANLEKMREFCRTFEQMNLVGDKELSYLIKQAKELIEGVDPKTVRSESALRDSLETAFTKLKEESAAMISLGGERVFLEEEPA
jgi:hypothetical protein